MAAEMIDEGLIKDAELWVKMAEDKQALSYNNNDNEVLHLLKTEIEATNVFNEGYQLFKTLCKNLDTTGHYKIFKNSSTLCRYSQEGGNPLFIKKLEELSQEPIVNIIHDFLTKQEVTYILKQLGNYEFNPAPYPEYVGRKYDKHLSW